MTEFANPGLLNLQALYVDKSDSHAREGVHVRVAHHPLLGLPAAPFVLERADVRDRDFKQLNHRTDAVWRSKAGNILQPPFSMSQGDEVVVTLPSVPTVTALWAEIIADPGSPLTFRTAMQVKAFVRSANDGLSALGSRSEPPFAFSAPGLVSFVIRGNGTVVGIRWIDAERPQKLGWRVIDVLNLPHPGGSRYVSLSNWEQLCASRLQSQTPQRRPMQDLSSALPRFSAPGHNSAQEFKRVQTLFDGLNKPLDELITGPVPQHEHVTRHTLTNATGGTVLPDGTAEARVPTLGLVLQGQVDPGSGSWMGYKTLDQDNTGDSEYRLSLYRLTAYFPNPTDQIMIEGGVLTTLLISAARATHGLSSHTELFNHFTNLVKGWLGERGIEATSALSPFSGFDMGALAVADYLAPLDPLTPPSLDVPRHVNWLPARIGTPIRVTETGVNDVPVAGALTLQMRQPPASGMWRALNKDKNIGQGIWRTLILPSPPSENPSAPAPIVTTPAQALITDNRTGPDDFTLHAANMDRFGRYSDFDVATGKAGPRPKPPRPVLLGSYRQPDISTNLSFGRITATVPLPEEAALAPGAFSLLRAQLTVRVDGAAFGPVQLLPVAGAISIHPNTNIPGQNVPAGEDQRGVRITFDGPAISRTQTRKLEIIAVWVDTAAQISTPSEPLRLSMVDPYPPTQIPIPDVLDYAARPDATGTAWVERDIPGSTAQRYAIYYADENRLRDHLRNSADSADTALLATLVAEPDPAVRAGALRTAQERFPASLFERLEEAIETSPTLRFRHGLPGTLRILSAYKIAVESAANAAGPDLTTLDTVFYGVPNSDPPARPSITVRLVPATSGESELVAEVTVTLRPGMSEGSVARIRRTRSGVVDPIRNPIIATISMQAVDPATGLQTAIFRDVGTALVAPAARLAAFVNYAWLAEVQGAPEPGSMAAASGTVPGLWGPPSAPTTLTIVPRNGPVAPTLLGGSSTPAIGGRRNIRINFSYPIDLTPGSSGPWLIRIERALPDQGLTLISEESASAGTLFVVESAAGEVLPSGTRYRLRLIDPVGRESPAIEHII
ncbi:hypothetical protein [Granulosicoccus antarcticus]|uniref:Uncharacterized protein n=1 Tax=Granulosicoccus antarcticus IMCC3135 TaxID=1192854 RepID=A0A2Z2NPV8_9GAMM|nr:hypothetical protein [Granulosicoccus antarcticus]ASJ73309.1 hypothetical protein IMCC3135_16135 [Granulosicoccus antarcticus IMCC3135]